MDYIYHIRTSEGVTEPNTSAISYSATEPPLNKKFPVHRPGGLKRADWNFVFHIFKKIPTSRFAVFFPTRNTGNDILLKGGLGAWGLALVSSVTSTFERFSFYR